jgi:hypothetical protein
VAGTIRSAVTSSAVQITELLRRVHTGDEQALGVVIPLVYEELKKARRDLNAGRNGSIELLDSTPSTTVRVRHIRLEKCEG